MKNNVGIIFLSSSKQFLCLASFATHGRGRTFIKNRGNGMSDCNLSRRLCGMWSGMVLQFTVYYSNTSQRDFRFKTPAEVPGGENSFTRHKSLFPFNVHLRRICGYTAIKQASGNGLQKKGPPNCSCLNFHGLGNVFALCMHVV